MTQTASCRDCGLRPIVRVVRGPRVAYYTDLLDAYYVTAYLACGHRRDVAMSIHNIEAVRG